MIQIISQLPLDKNGIYKSPSMDPVEHEDY